MRYFVHILLFFGGLLALVGCRDTRPRMLGFSGGDGGRFSGLCAHAPLLEKLQFPTTDSIRLSARIRRECLGPNGSDSVQLGASDAIVVATLRTSRPIVSTALG